MPNRSSITINDGQAAPVAHVFTPDGQYGDVSNFQDTSGGTPIGYWLLKVGVRKPVPGSAAPVHKVTLSIMRPTMDVTAPSTGSGIQPAPSVAYYCTSKHEFLLPARSTLAERKDILALAKNLLANSDIVTVVQNCEGYW